MIRHSTAIWLYSLILSPLCISAHAQTLVPLKTKPEFDTYYIHIGIAGAAPQDYLVDTGAGYMTITQSTLDELKQAGTAAYVKDLEGHLADGSIMRVPVYRLDEITVGRSCQLYGVDAAVLPGASRGLFGLSALRKVSPFELSFDPPTLRVSNCLVEPEPLPAAPLATFPTPH